MIRKSDMVRQYVSDGDFKRALAIAKGFRIGIAESDRGQMTRAYECMVHPDFYKELGTDVEDEIRKGIEIVKRIYGKEE